MQSIITYQHSAQTKALLKYTDLRQLRIIIKTTVRRSSYAWIKGSEFHNIFNEKNTVWEYLISRIGDCKTFHG